MNQQKEIDIVPVFDQSVANIWSDFTRIEMTCDKEMCGYAVGPADKKRIYTTHGFEWKNYKYKFAFAAYDQERMVGFASGYRENMHDMYLHNLYVLPEYSGHGIGRKLLEQCERSSALVSDTMTLNALSGALKFYEKCGYAIHDKRDCEKKLPKEIIGVVPVFVTLGWLRAKNRTDFDPAILKPRKYGKIMAYVSLGREIDGIGVVHPDGEQDVWTNPNKRGMKDFYEKKLLTALAKIR